ncbi:hypothetical protein LCGC14_2042170 [marine sediment metagenome]|uniref:Uncharacterized protein n=1 Tax=marine sediment metagenome TaxID=412755 RepID=A0A0F9FE41_9ZZZZ
MKIVINGCCGGFSLSHAAFLRLREMKNESALAEPDYGEMWDDGSGPRRESGSEMFAHFLSNIDRSDPQLVVVVEELGEKANGGFANLEIVEIPDGVDWEVEEYDGREWISEKHQTWG